MGGKGRPFKPGQSGNPGGRPKVLADVRDFARQYCSESIEGLWEIASNKRAPAAARVAAYNSILDRGYGKPLQHAEIVAISSHDTRKASEMTDDELAALLQRFSAEDTKSQSESEQPNPRTLLTAVTPN